jgi:hypothetical protein
MAGGQSIKRCASRLSHAAGALARDIPNDETSYVGSACHASIGGLRV